MNSMNSLCLQSKPPEMAAVIISSKMQKAIFSNRTLTLDFV